MSKTESLNISLTDEMKKFITSQSGNGTLYATPSEYVRDLIRHDYERIEAAQLRDKIIDGYHDAIFERTTEFSGNLKNDLASFKMKKK